MTSRLLKLLGLLAGIIEEVVYDTLDNAAVSEDIEEEVDKVLTAIAGETAAQLPEAVRKEKMMQPAQAAQPFSLYLFSLLNMEMVVMLTNELPLGSIAIAAGGTQIQHLVKTTFFVMYYKIQTVYLQINTFYAYNCYLVFLEIQ